MHAPHEEHEEPWLPQLVQSRAFLDGVVAHSALSGEVAGRLLSPPLVDADEMAAESRWTPHLGTSLVEMAEAIARSFEVDRSLAQPGEAPPPLLVAEHAEAATPPPALSWPESGTTEPVLSPRPAGQQVAPQEAPPLRTLGDLLRRELARQQNPNQPSAATERPRPAVPPAAAGRDLVRERPTGAEARSLPPRRARIVELPSSPAAARPEPLPPPPEPPGTPAEPDPSAATAGVSLPMTADVAALAPQAPAREVASGPIAQPVPPPSAPAALVPRQPAAVAPLEASHVPAPMAPPRLFPPPAPAEAAETPPGVESSPPPTRPRLDQRPMSRSSPQERPAPPEPPSSQEPPSAPAAATEREEQHPGSAAVPSAPLRAGPAASGPEVHAPTVLSPAVAPPSQQPSGEPTRPRPRFPLLGALAARLLGRRPHEDPVQPKEHPPSQPAAPARRPDERPTAPQAALEPLLESEAEATPEPASAPELGQLASGPALPAPIEGGVGRTPRAATAEQRPEMQAPEPPGRPLEAKTLPERPGGLPKLETLPATRVDRPASEAAKPPPADTQAPNTAPQEPALDSVIEGPARPDEPPRAAVFPPRSGPPARSSRYTLPRDDGSSPAGLDDTPRSPWLPTALEQPSPPAGFAPGGASFAWPATSAEVYGTPAVSTLQAPDLMPVMAPHLPELVLAPAANDRAEVETSPEQEDPDPRGAAGRGGREAPAPDVETLSREVYSLLKRRIALERERGFGR